MSTLVKATVHKYIEINNNKKEKNIMYLCIN